MAEDAISQVVVSLELNGYLSLNSISSHLFQKAFLCRVEKMRLANKAMKISHAAKCSLGEGAVYYCTERKIIYYKYLKTTCKQITAKKIQGVQNNAMLVFYMMMKKII